MAAAVKNRAGNSDIVKGPCGFGCLFRMKLNNPWCRFFADYPGRTLKRGIRFRPSSINGNRASFPC